uniref:Complex 1 LYR protein domain-containing protein n=1 Tax=Globodera rostochiensis TaxID=31243 RepID=A0A914HSH1_GLORO
MLIQENFRLQFYERVRREHSLIVTNTDVDSLCATNILTHIFSCDDATYTLSPVDSFSTLEKAINNHIRQARNIVLVNCIGPRSIHELNIAELTNDVKIWILESRRPLNLEDIYNAESVRVLAPASEVSAWELPDASSIFEVEDGSDDNDENQPPEGSEAGENEEETDGGDEDEAMEAADNGEPGEEDSNGFPPENRRGELISAIERRTLRRQEKIRWRKNRKELLWNYYLKTWYSAPVSLFMLELAHELGKGSAEMMWCATVGLNSMYIDQLISVETYSELCMDRLRPFIRKYGLRSGTTLEQSRGNDQLRIVYDKELTLPLYPHWTLYDSMSNDPFFICQGKLWSQRGEDKFKEILAQLGLTLAECIQNYEAMKKERRQEVFDILEKHIGAGFYSFTSHLGYSTAFSASDFARALSIQLEYKPPKQQQEEMANSTVEDAEQLCSRRSGALNDLLKRCIVQSHVISASNYFIVTIGPQSPALGFFTSRHCLSLFTHSLQRAFASSKASRRSKPFLVSVPMLGPNIGYFLVTGVMPLTEQLADVSRKSIIGKAFERAAEAAHIDLRHTFDSNVVLLKSEDRLRFFNHLEARLEIVVKMSSMSFARSDWLKLYKALQRAGSEFPQYNYRHFARRRIRDYFESYRKQTIGQEKLSDVFKEGQAALTTIRRQSQISSLYPVRPLVIEANDAQKLNASPT